MEEHGETAVERDTREGEVVRKSDGSDGPPVLRVVKNVNTPGATNSALSQPAPKEDEGVDLNHPARGRRRAPDHR
mgnify:CR=1 FL=1